MHALDEETNDLDEGAKGGSTRRATHFDSWFTSCFLCLDRLRRPLLHDQVAQVNHKVSLGEKELSLVLATETDLVNHIVELFKAGPILLAFTRLDHIHAESQEGFK